MINQTLWMSQPKEVREKMREIFSIKRSSFIWVDGDIIKTDGTTDEDLKALTDDKLQEFSGTSGSSEEMFLECVNKIKALKPLEAVEQVVDEDLAQKPDSEAIISSNNELKCQHCEFVGKNERSLRLHNIKKHK